MRTFPNTRAAAGYDARHACGELAGRVKDGERAMDDDTLAVQVRRQPGRPPAAAAACMWSPPGTRSGGCSPSPAWTGRYRWPAPGPRPLPPWRRPGASAAAGNGRTPARRALARATSRTHSDATLPVGGDR